VIEPVTLHDGLSEEVDDIELVTEGVADGLPDDETVTDSEAEVETDGVTEFPEGVTRLVGVEVIEADFEGVNESLADADALTVNDTDCVTDGEGVGDTETDRDVECDVGVASSVSVADKETLVDAVMEGVSDVLLFELELSVLEAETETDWLLDIVTETVFDTEPEKVSDRDVVVLAEGDTEKVTDEVPDDEIVTFVELDDDWVAEVVTDGDVVPVTERVTDREGV